MPKIKYNGAGLANTKIYKIKVFCVSILLCF